MEPGFQRRTLHSSSFYFGCVLGSPRGGEWGALKATGTEAQPQRAGFTRSEIGLALRIVQTSPGGFHVQPGLGPAALRCFWRKMNYSP